MDESPEEYETFVRTAGPRLRAALIAAYGAEVGLDSSSEALAYGWENWDRLSEMANPAGYLYRVGQTAARKLRRPDVVLPRPEPEQLPHIEPGLLPALEQLTEQQRVSVLLVKAHGWTLREAAEVLEVTVPTVRTHIARGMEKLQLILEASPDGT